MHGFTVRQQYDTEKPSVHFWNRSPAANPTVLLHGFTQRGGDRMQNPLITDKGPVWPEAHRVEILGEFHGARLTGKFPGRKASALRHARARERRAAARRRGPARPAPPAVAGGRLGGVSGRVGILPAGLGVSPKRSYTGGERPRRTVRRSAGGTPTLPEISLRRSASTADAAVCS